MVSETKPSQAWQLQALQQTKGYEQFESRRQAKYSKAIDGGAMGRRNGMDEGVDVQLQ